MDSRTRDVVSDIACHRVVHPSDGGVRVDARERGTAGGRRGPSAQLRRGRERRGAPPDLGAHVRRQGRPREACQTAGSAPHRMQPQPPG